jgi:arginine/serine-rich splicing factor 2
LVYRTGESRGFAFVRYKYADEAQKAVEKLDGQFTFPNSIATSMLEAGVLFIEHFYCLLGKIVDGREIMVQFAKYGPNAERM